MFFHKRLCYILTSIIIITSFCSSVFAESLQNKLDNLNNEAAAKKNEINAVKSRELTVSEQLRNISAQVNNATAAYNNVKNQLDTTQKKIDNNEQLLQGTQKKLSKRQEILDKRIRDIYMHGQISYIDVLVGANSFSDFLTRLSLVKRIIRYDYNLISSIMQEKQTITATKKELESDRSKTAKLVQSAKEKYNILKTTEDQKQALLYKVQHDRKTAEQAYDEIVAASRQVEQLIQNYNSQYDSSSTPAGNGTFIWPLSGPITSPFGWRVHPLYGRRIFHTGIDIGGSYGTPIHAAASGTVIYAGWISGYGNAVIISHGGGLETLYGHNQSLAVSQGQHVSQGQVISYCGSTGNSTGPHCHFEVRKNGHPVNPLNYL
ncbi:murein hydrolase activator EnvC family protein [Pectinatus sottacetonis]|uniref:murein hydrolase activator EnvC family protein n=1 Tax=Pectinatus sottacetonis TaxID=1002795 RepID=UPI0018C82DA6|nr:peptidoglycan DD-metalloendopeptidase family protein [Pectinatus sottacetonis]